jgi:hypothetical protein
VDLAAVAVLRVEDQPVLALAPQHPLHELEDDVGFLDVVVGLDPLAGQQAAAAHPEGHGPEAPVVHAVDLRTDFPPGAGADVDDALGPDLVGDVPHDLGVAVELVHERQDLVLLAGDHARDTLGGPHDEHVPDVPGQVVVEVVQLVEGELVLQHLFVADLLQDLRLHPGADHLVAQDPVGDRVHALVVALVQQGLEAQAVVVGLVALEVFRLASVGQRHCSSLLGRVTRPAGLCPCRDRCSRGSPSSRRVQPRSRRSASRASPPGRTGSRCPRRGGRS